MLAKCISPMTLKEKSGSFEFCSVFFLLLTVAPSPDAYPPLKFCRGVRRGMEKAWESEIISVSWQGP